MKIFDPKLTGSIEILNTITGNVTIAGSLNVDGQLGGSVTGSSTASYVDFSNIDNLPTLLSSSNQLAGQTIDGDLTITGKLTAQEYHTELVSASIIYESGSTQFGNSSDDTHAFTGKATITYQDGSSPYSPGLVVVNTNSGGGTGKIQIGGTSGAGEQYFGEIGFDGDILQFYNDRVSSGGSATSPHMIINSSGNVGIGTTSPSAKLHVKGAGNYDGLIIADNSTTTGGGILQVRQNAVTVGSLTAEGSVIGNSSTNLSLFAETGNSITFFTNGSGTERMRIDSSGNVGIGGTITSLSDTDELSLFAGTAVVDNRARIELYGPSHATLADQAFIRGEQIVFTSDAASTERMRIDSNGQHTFTATAGDTLIVQKSNDQPSIRIKGSTGNDYAFRINSTTFELTKNDGATAILSATQSGNVGIGTSSPAVKMQVVGSGSIFRISDDVSASGTLDLKATSSAATINANTYSAAVPLTFEIASSEKMRITSSGNVGIGGSADQYSTSFSKFITLTDSTASGYTVIEAAGGSGGGGGIHLGNQTVRQAGIFSLDGSDLAFYTNSTNSGSGLTERMRIDSSGNVGIGTTSPAYPLHVEAASGGSQVYLSRGGAVLEMYMGGTTGTGTQFYMRAGGVGGVRLDYSATSWVSASDIRLKNISSEISGTLNKLENIRAVNFSWKNDEENKNNYGVIAQEVEAEFPELVSESSIDNMKGVKYTEFVPILISAIKELKAEIETLKQQINN